MNLWEQRAELLKQAKAMLETAQKEERGLDEQELKTYGELDAKIDLLTATIRANEKINSFANEGQQRQTFGETQTAKKVSDEEHRDAFNRYLRTNDASELRALQIGTDSEGGYAVPTEMQATIIELLQADSVVRSVATTYPISGKISIPTETSIGAATYVDEEGSGTGSDPAFGQANLDPEKLVHIVLVSEEMLADSVFPLESYLARLFARTFAAGEETGFTTGSGTGAPRGFTLDATVGKQTTGSATGVTADEIKDMFYSVSAPYRRKGVWMFNDTTIKAIDKITNAVSGDYLWRPGLSEGRPDTLMGKPVLVNNALADMASNALFGAFGDFSFYHIGDRQSITIKRLNELYMATGQIGFRGMARHDGLLTNTVAVKTFKSKA